jgi:hypothetical protein
VAIVLVLAVGVVLLYFIAIYVLRESPRVRQALLPRPIRRSLEKARGRGLVLTPLAETPAELDATTRILDSLGFVRVAEGTLRGRTVMSILVRPKDGVIAKVIWSEKPVPRTEARTKVSLISVASQRRGAFHTTDTGYDFDGFPSRLTQVFPYASVDLLAERHEDAIRILERYGVQFDPADVDDAVDIAEWLELDALSWLLAQPDYVLVDVVVAMARNRIKESMDLQSMLDKPDTIARIDVLRGTLP